MTNESSAKSPVPLELKFPQPKIDPDCLKVFDGLFSASEAARSFSKK